MDLPKEAFIDLDTLKRLNAYGTVYHLHLAPVAAADHPDPKEVNLQLLAKVMKLMLEISSGGWHVCRLLRVSAAEAGDRTYAPLSPCSSTPLNAPFPPLCAQLHEPLPEGSEWRGATEVEHTVFKKSLSNMMEWYAHPCVHVQAQRLPKGYLTGFKFPPGMEPNLADYINRCERWPAHSPHLYSHTRCGLDFAQGWCF